MQPPNPSPVWGDLKRSSAATHRVNLNAKSTAMSSAISRLSSLAKQINQLIADCQEALETAQRAENSALTSAKEAGLLLMKAKAQVKHGEWLPWLEANCSVTPRHAQNYMQIAERWEEIEESGAQTLSAAIKVLKRSSRLKAADEPQQLSLPAANLTPDEVAVILPTFEKSTVERNWQSEFGEVILALAAQGIQPEETNAPVDYLKQKYPAAAKLEAVSGRQASIIKEAAAALAQGEQWLQNPDMFRMLDYKSRQYDMSRSEFEATAREVLQKHAPAPIQAPQPAVEVAPSPSLDRQVIEILQRCNQQEIEAVLQWLEDHGYLLQTEPEAQTKNEIHFAFAEDEPANTSLEQAILFLAGRCDGASSDDGIGFSGADTGFGHWLADRISDGKPLIRKWAASAHRMLQKYRRTQLEPNGYGLPDWSEIEAHYPEEIKPVATPEAETSGYRLELHGGLIVAHSPYDPTRRLNEIYKSVPGWEFDGATKAWTFPVKQAAQLLEALGERLEQYEIDPAIQAAIDAAEADRYQQAMQAAEEIIQLVEAAKLDEPLPSGRTLFQHQKDGVSWLLSHRKNGILPGGILADQMGLGKTVEALVAAKAMRAVYDCPILVICPASLQENWLREAEGVGVAIEVFSWAKMPKPLDTAKYVLIGDEAHYIQSLSSQRTKNFLALAHHPNCLASWALTGTPIKNGRPINLYPLLLATGHPLANDKKQYERYFCAAREKSVGRGRTIWDNTGAAHLDELAKKTEDAILRRTKQECLDLPEKIRSLRPVELSAEASKIYNAKLSELVANYKERLAKKLISDEGEALVTLGQLRLAGSVAKVEPAIEMAQDLLEQGEQVILFTEFTESAKAIHEALGGELLTGETPTEERQAIVDRFQSGESKVFVGTIKAGGVGLTLTAASFVILVDRPWAPGDAEQAEDRAHRIGQNATVNAIWLQYGLIDTSIDQLLQQKSDRIELVLKGKRKTLRGLGNPAELAKELLLAL
jgi:hypothetical protein